MEFYIKVLQWLQVSTNSGQLINFKIPTNFINFLQLKIKVLHIAIESHLDELIRMLAQISRDEYSKPILALNNATIGAHMRHSIEMFECLLESGNGILNYDLRKRNPVFENDPASAAIAIQRIKRNIFQQDRELLLQTGELSGQRIKTNFLRELLYTLEHSIHHQALIKVGLRDFPHINIDADFGVARSTIEYRTQCAQ